MRKILIVDNNRGFISDVETVLILEEIDGLDIYTADSIDAAYAEVEKERPDEVVIAGSLVPSISKDTFGTALSCYVKSMSEMEQADDKGIPCYGIVGRASDLLSALESGKTKQVKKGAAPARQPRTAPKQPLRRDDTDFDDFFDEEEIPETKPRREEQKAPSRKDENNTAPRREDRRPAPRREDRWDDADDDGYQTRSRRVDEEPLRRVPDPSKSPESKPISSRNQIRQKMEEARRQEEERQRALEAERRRQMERDAKRAVERDLGNIKDPARTVVVYSAKGGVGKTTISCELATFLALSAHGRGRMQVCVADFNIDFGDVLNTLDLDPNGMCMTHWAADIREQLEALPGDHSDGYTEAEVNSIQYSEKQVRRWLQKDERSGLYVLVAPITNEDSMDISEDGSELMVILRNLVENGGFDYVVCDTGNNTRDSSFIPLERADDILLVLTQSVNTANCCNGFVTTVSKIGFDTSRIKVLINLAKPSKTVRVSTDELQEILIDPQTGRPFECVGIIKDSNDVRSAGNMGEPLVFNSNHEFTKSIGAVVSQINKETFTLEKPEKKRRGLFKFRRKDEE